MLEFKNAKISGEHSKLAKEIIEILGVWGYPEVVSRREIEVKLFNTYLGISSSIRKEISRNMRIQGYIRIEPKNNKISVRYRKQTKEQQKTVKKHIFGNQQQKRVDTLKKKHSDLVVKVPLVLIEAEYPVTISKTDIICRLEDYGIQIQSQSRSATITYLMLENGYIIGNKMSQKKCRGRKYIHYMKKEHAECIF